MLRILFHNDGSGERESPRVGNYDVTVDINGKVLYTTRVKGHRRKSGWQALVKQFANECDRSFLTEELLIRLNEGKDK